MNVYSKFLFLFFFLSCLLANTSFITISNVSLPLFWIPILLLIPAVKFRTQTWDLILSIIFLMIYIILIINNSEYFPAYASQFISRLMLIFIYFVLGCDVFLKNRSYFLISVFKITNLLLLLSLLSYLLLLIFDFNTGINNLANNISFGIRGNELLKSNGWADELRLSGFWSEPSYMVIPLLLFAFLLKVNSFNKKKNVILLSLFLLISFLSFSRSVWSAIIIYSVFLLLCNNKKILCFLYKFKYVCLLVCVFGVSFVFVTYGLLIGSDGSVSGRVGTTIVSLSMIKDHWLLGFGPNTFYALKNEPIYLINGMDLSYDNVIHSSILSLWQQFGIIAIPYVLYPYICILKKCNLELFKIIFPTLITVLISLILYGDFTYFSFYWLLLGVLSIYVTFPVEDSR